MTTDPKRKNYGGWAVLALGLLFVARPVPTCSRK